MTPDPLAASLKSVRGDRAILDQVSPAGPGSTSGSSTRLAPSRRVSRDGDRHPSSGQFQDGSGTIAAGHPTIAGPIIGEQRLSQKPHGTFSAQTDVTAQTDYTCHPGSTVSHQLAEHVPSIKVSHLDLRSDADPTFAGQLAHPIHDGSPVAPRQHLGEAPINERPMSGSPVVPGGTSLPEPDRSSGFGFSRLAVSQRVAGS